MKEEQSNSQHPDTAEACASVDPATRQLLGELVQEAVAADRRARRRVFSRRMALALTTVVLAGAGLWGSTALAAGSNCATGLICFSAGDPAVADDVNQNFKTLKTWLQDKVGAVGSPVQMGANAALNDHELRLRHTGDRNHYIKWSSSNDGPELAGLGAVSIGTVDTNGVFDQGMRVSGSRTTISGETEIYGETSVYGNTTAKLDLTVDGDIHADLVRFKLINLQYNTSKDTGMSKYTWNCAIGSAYFGVGDIWEDDGSNEILRMTTFTNAASNNWQVLADFKSHYTDESKQVGIVCFRKSISRMENDWFH